MQDKILQSLLSFQAKCIEPSLINFERYLEYPWIIKKLNLKRNMKVLDVGSGRSILPLYMASLGAKVYCLDICRLSSLERSARNLKLNVKFVVQDARTSLPFPDNFFDVITAISSIEHFHDDGDIKAMKEFIRVLKKDGLIFLSFPYHHDFRKKEWFVYSDSAIEKRLLKPFKLQVNSTAYWIVKYPLFPIHLTLGFIRTFIRIIIKTMRARAPPVLGYIYHLTFYGYYISYIEKQLLHKLPKNRWYGGICISVRPKSFN